MQFSRDWLRDYADLPASLDELARRLTQAGLAVEGTEAAGDDVLLDVEVTTNRPDCMNHVGLAREIAVIFDEPLRRPATIVPEVPEPAGGAAAVEVEDAEGCPRYVARVVRGVRVGPSPEWLVKRLSSIGLRPINDVVDVTNFVLWELGQPLHAFDLDRLAGRRVVVRRARQGERLTTLDGTLRELDPAVLVIADAERPAALAGIMGGAASEVTGTTTDVLIESAHFDRKTVRLAARKLGMHTDASHRFERGTDPELCLEAANRAAALIAELAGGEILAGAIDVRAETPQWPPRGFLDLGHLNAFAGAEIPRSDVKRWLTGLGFKVRTLDDGVWEVTVPSWRYFDFELRPDGDGGKIYPADLYEEVLRLYGYDKVPAALPAVAGPDAPASPGQVLRRKVREHLAACGYAEAVNFAFQAPAMDAAFPTLRPDTEPLPLANPISERYAVMRRSLVPNLAENARFNQRRGLPAVRLFEVGRVFFPPPPDAEPEREGSPPLPDQPENVALICGGRVGTPWDRAMDLDLFDLKGAVDSLAEALGSRLVARPAELPGVVSGTGAELTAGEGGPVVGFFGRIEAEEGFPLYAAEIATAALAGGVSPPLVVELPSRYPGVTADLTLTHPLAVAWAEIDRAIAESAPADLVSYGLKDRYRGPGVPDGAVNTTISFLYNARDRSLTQEEVNERQGTLAAALEQRFGWKG